MRNDFAVFILTHGRPDKVITHRTLARQGYTGKIYFIIDNEDQTADKYYQNFGDSVIMFDKKLWADKIDEGNNFDERRTITHARNACFQIAKDLGLKYFMQLDDDYTKFDYRINSNNKFPSNNFKIKDIEPLFEYLIEYFETINCLSIAISQGGDWIGGSQSSFTSFKIRRKAMNSFLCSVDRPFYFVGAMNEDVNTYTTLGSRGYLFLTIPFISLTQKETQSQSGGITDMYLRYGTYCKSFTTVMMKPSSVVVSEMKTEYKRLHHYISWKNTVPMILRQEVKKL